MAQNNSNNNNNAKICPISLRTQSQIKNNNSKVFQVLDKDGKVLQIYDANLLVQWCDQNDFKYPHNMMPMSQIQKSRLNNLVSIKDTCPITKKKRQTLEQEGRPVFEVSEGDKVGQIYDAKLLAIMIINNSQKDDNDNDDDNDDHKIIYTYPYSNIEISQTDLNKLTKIYPKPFSDVNVFGINVIKEANTFSDIDENINYKGISIKDLLYGFITRIHEGFLDVDIIHRGKETTFKPSNTKGLPKWKKILGLKKTFIETVKKIYDCKIYTELNSFYYGYEKSILFRVLYKMDLVDKGPCFLYMMFGLGARGWNKTEIIFIDENPEHNYSIYPLPEWLYDILNDRKIVKILDDPEAVFYDSETPDSTKLNLIKTTQTAGGKKTYKGRKYVIRKGSRGGKYILVKGTKIYV
jgi:hypothetical protein